MFISSNNLVPNFSAQLGMSFVCTVVNVPNLTCQISSRLLSFMSIQTSLSYFPDIFRDFSPSILTSTCDIVSSSSSSADVSGPVLQLYGVKVSSITCSYSSLLFCARLEGFALGLTWVERKMQRPWEIILSLSPLPW